MFPALAESITAAAARLDWPKSTVSRRLSGLEQRLGERLLQRSTRRLSLTEFGQGVLEHAGYHVSHEILILSSVSLSRGSAS